MSTDRGNGPLRRAWLYLGWVSDEPQPASTYARGALTWFQLKMIALYAVLSGVLWVTWATRGGQTSLELAVFFSGLCLWMAFVALRRARTQPPSENVGGSS